jgi:hypothetical protein
VTKRKFKLLIEENIFTVKCHGYSLACDNNSVLQKNIQDVSGRTQAVSTNFTAHLFSSSRRNSGFVFDCPTFVSFQIISNIP